MDTIDATLRDFMIAHNVRCMSVMTCLDRTSVYLHWGDLSLGNCVSGGGTNFAEASADAVQQMLEIIAKAERPK